MKRQKTDPAPDTSPAFDPAGLLATMPFADAFGRGATMMSRSLAAMQRESVRFMNKRLEDNMRVAGEMGACRNLPDMLALQQKWLAGLTRAYADEWQRYNELMAEIVSGDAEEPGPAAANGSRHPQAS